MNTHHCYRLRIRDIEHLIRLTESFSWEELPIRDADTGNLTKAGHIPITQAFATYGSAVIYTVHAIQSAVHIATSYDMIFPAWFPFDTSVSPAYEIIIFVQVIHYECVKQYWTYRKCYTK
jgi:hypothetical protein